MEPLTLTAGAIATLVLVKATEKAGEKLGELVVEKAGKLLSLLKTKLPRTATAIEVSEHQPLDYGKAVLELEAAMKDPEVAKAVEEVDTAVKADPEVAKLVEDVANTLKSKSPSTQNFMNIVEKVVNFAQGDKASIVIENQNINI
ncbi:hypothetical protein [Microcoleus sp. CAWBG58]|uniref:hypothetical protein n=1 Tax=Microcoleus sp. CAWBG58 TaxID=2841651 RepID=UPI0025EF6626|nr:hypothetical protein [Microcoleus sp. CAWBG58]